MRDPQSTLGTPADAKSHPVRVVISPWINERPPPLHELLSSHDVARLTRRPSWLIASLSLIGRFPKQIKSRGQRTGWLRSQVLDWMARELAVVTEHAPKPPARVRACSRQACLPLNCATPCALASECSNLRRRKPRQPVGVRP